MSELEVKVYKNDRSEGNELSGTRLLHCFLPSPPGRYAIAIVEDEDGFIWEIDSNMIQIVRPEASE